MFSVTVDAAPVCERSVAGGASRRVDCAVTVPWDPDMPHDLAVQGPATWTLDYLELATHHGNTDGAHYMLVLPASSAHYVRPGWGLVLTAGTILIGAILFLPAPPPLPRGVRMVYRAVVGAVVLELAAVAISQWISDYRIVLSAGTFARLLVLPLTPRLWVAGQRAARGVRQRMPQRGAALLKRLWLSVYHPGIDVPKVTVEAGWRTRLLVALGMTAFGVALLHSQLQQMDAVPDRGDPLLSIWRLAWVYHQMTGDPRALFDANIYHPARSTLAFSDSTLLPAVINSPLLAAGLHPVVVYNVTLLASFLASAFTCYLLVEGLTGSTAAGFIGGLLFGFYPFRYEHYAHYELLMAYWMPLSLLALHRFMATTKARYALLAALFTVAQLYSSMYFAVLYLWVAAVLFAILWKLTRPDVRKIVRGAILAAVLAVAMAFPLARVYTAAQLPERSAEEVALYSAELSDYFHAHSRSAFWGDKLLPDSKPERALFPGLVILVLAAVALFPPVGPTRLAYAGALAFSVELTRGYNSFLYRLLYEILPFMRGLRAPARASVLVGLTLAVLAGFAVQRLLTDRSRTWATVLFTTLTMLIGVELYPRLTFEQVWHEPPGIYQNLQGRHDVVLAEFPLGLVLAEASETLRKCIFPSGIGTRSSTDTVGTRHAITETFCSVHNPSRAAPLSSCCARAASHTSPSTAPSMTAGATPSWTKLARLATSGCWPPRRGKDSR